MELLEDDIEVMLREDSLNDALQYDDDQPLVKSVVLQHVKQHAQPGPAGLAAYNSPQLVREAGEERSPSSYSGPHCLRLLPGRTLGRREATRPEVVLDVVEVPGHGLGGGEAGEVVHDLLVDRVAEHGLDDLPEHDDHLSPQPDVSVRQVEYLVQQPEGDPQGNVVTVVLQASADLTVAHIVQICLDVLLSEDLADAVHHGVHVPHYLRGHRVDCRADSLHRPLNVLRDIEVETSRSKIPRCC